MFLKMRAGEKRPKKAFTLIEIMITATVILLLASLAIPGFFRAMQFARDNVAIKNLKVISGALDTYADRNSGKYPPNESVLTSANPPYLTESFCDQTKGGFTYLCDLSPSNYQIAAVYANAVTEIPADGKIGYYVDSSGNVIELNTDVVAGSEGAPPPSEP